MKKILLNLVYPNFQESVVNKKLLDGIKNIENITINNLYDKYVDFKIDVKAEQKLLLENDIILFQFPMYWFSSPSLLKEWFDLVLTSGFAHDGTYQLENKSFAIAISCGGSKEAFCETGKDKKRVEEFLFPFSITANYIKMNYKKAFVTYDTEKELSMDILNEYVENYVDYIKKL